MFIRAVRLRWFGASRHLFETDLRRASSALARRAYLCGFGCLRAASLAFVGCLVWPDARRPLLRALDGIGRERVLAQLGNDKLMQFLWTAVTSAKLSAWVSNRLSTMHVDLVSEGLDASKYPP